MSHPCAQEHPYRLSDVPADLLFGWWQDTVSDDADSAEVFTAWADVPAPRAAA